MALLKHLDSTQRWTLEPEHSIGRRVGSALTIRQPYVSGRHALVRWTGTLWELRDLGSRNGTYHNGELLPPGVDRPLRVGDRIAFGRREQQWVVEDISPPVVAVLPINGGTAIAPTGNMFVMPSTEAPEVTIYKDASGAWMLEHADSVSYRIRHAQVFEVNGQCYKFVRPEIFDKTCAIDAPPDICMASCVLEFAVSRDEEHVELAVRVQRELHRIGAHSQNYLLLTLARRRLAEAANGNDDAAAGWMYQDELVRGLQITDTQLNVDVYRIRQRVSRLSLPDPAAIIERRTRTRQLRIGTGNLIVTSS